MSTRIGRYMLLISVFVAGMCFAYVAKPMEWLQGTAAAQPGCQAFSATGKSICGRFQEYWNQNGGLAQQGLPLSGEFTEVNDLDGKSYTVQYFERAVFEKHPENARPFDVLLSQLGTFQFKRKYPNGEPGGTTPPPQPPPPPPGGNSQIITGTGTKVSDPVSIKKGLAVIQSEHFGSGGNFIVELVDSTGTTVDLLANEIGPANVPEAIEVKADASFLLKVRATGDWKITITQPTSTYSAPPVHQEWSGHGSFVTPLFSLKAGALRIKATHTNGTRNFIVYLVDQNGRKVELLANVIGPGDIETIENVPANGVFLVTVRADGDWKVSLDQ